MQTSYNQNKIVIIATISMNRSILKSNKNYLKIIVKFFE